jgi:hypothetical protein
LLITTWAIGRDGSLQPPDRNREITLAQLEKEYSVVLEESVLRLDKKLVYSISGSIRLPHLKRTLQITQLGNDELETIVVYEGDVEKAVYPVNDVPEEAARQENTEIGREGARRLAAYEAHVEQLKQELGLAQSQK